MRINTNESSDDMGFPMKLIGRVISGLTDIENAVDDWDEFEDYVVTGTVTIYKKGNEEGQLTLKFVTDSVYEGEMAER